MGNGGTEVSGPEVRQSRGLESLHHHPVLVRTLAMETEIGVGGYELTGLDAMNVVLGRNGCGKSTLLRALKTVDGFHSVEYVTPERGGMLTYNPGIDQSMSANESWLQGTRAKNQDGKFKEATVSRYRELEYAVLREIESERRSDFTYTFDRHLEQINSLLEHVQLVRGSRSGFSFRRRSDQRVVQPASLSSGESELVSLAIEALSAWAQTPSGGTSLILLDEPDVHLHPDLQRRLVAFLCSLMEGGRLQFIVATHSTAILGSLQGVLGARFSFMVSGARELVFRPVSEATRRLLPVFGAHALTQAFNESPPLLVEGDDDVRIWQQAVRSSQGRLRFFPVACDSVDELNDYELEASALIEAVYDHGKAFSLRDGDDNPGEAPGNSLPNVGPVRRFRLHCRAAENLVLTDDVLAACGTSWPAFREHLDGWLSRNESHSRAATVRELLEGNDRRNSDLKRIRNLLLGELDTTKPWEVLVGQAIWVAFRDRQGGGPDSISAYLGTEFVGAVQGQLEA